MLDKIVHIVEQYFGFLLLFSVSNYRVYGSSLDTAYQGSKITGYEDLNDQSQIAYHTEENLRTLTLSSDLEKGETLTVKASSSRKKAIALYKKLLKKGKDGNFIFKSFVLLDVNKDKIPELFIKTSDPQVAFCGVRIYSVKKNKLFLCGEYSSKTHYSVLYYLKFKRVSHEWWTNSIGGYGYLLYNISLKKEGEGIVPKYRAYGSNLGYTIGVPNLPPLKTNISKHMYRYILI